MMNTKMIKALQVLSLVCVLAMVLALAACTISPQPPSDSAVIEAAKKFAAALDRAGEDAQVIIEKAREEAKKWGPKAELFIQTVIEELQK
jgi:predicted lipoprotein